MHQLDNKEMVGGGGGKQVFIGWTLWRATWRASHLPVTHAHVATVIPPLAPAPKLWHTTKLGRDGLVRPFANPT